MIWLLWKLITLPVRVAVGSTRLGLVTGYRAGRLLGYRRIVVFLVGVGVGLLLAPIPGAKLREKLKEKIDEKLNGAPPKPETASSAGVIRAPVVS